jgi:hypothetical protein
MEKKRCSGPVFFRVLFRTRRFRRMLGDLNEWYTMQPLFNGDPKLRQGNNKTLGGKKI